MESPLIKKIVTIVTFFVPLVKIPRTAVTFS